MKQTLSIVLILFTFCLEGQNTIQHNKIWGVVDTYISPDNMSVVNYYFKGDTIIDNKNYLKLYEDKIVGVTITNFTGYLLREENNKIFIKNQNNQESILYDFTLEKGDSISVKNQNQPIILEVIQVSTHELLNHELKKKIILEPIKENNIPDSLSYEIVWVESLGSLTTFHNYFANLIDLNRYELGCVTIDSELVYINNEGSECLLLNSEQQDENEDFIYPNPTSDKIFINANSQIKHIEIYNSVGQLTVKLGNIDEIDVSKFENGIYYLIIKSDNKKIGYKFIKL